MERYRRTAGPRHHRSPPRRHDCRRRPPRRGRHPRPRSPSSAPRSPPPAGPATRACCCPATTSSASSPRCPTSAACRRAIRRRSCASTAGSASLAVHHSERGATSPTSSRSPTHGPPRASRRCARELRGVLGVIAELRRSRRLPELLRAGTRARRAGRRRRRLGRPRRRRAGASVLAAVDVGGARRSWCSTGRATTSPSCRSPQSIRNDVTEGVDKQQREYLLRQQLAAIRKELGEGDDDVVGEYRDRARPRSTPPERRTRCDRQGDRPARAHQPPVARARLDPHLARPRLRAAVGQPQRRHARSRRRPRRARRRPLRPRDVKDRIVEFLAVRKLRHERGRRRARDATRRRGNGAIITLVGPPGVGKTSLGESVARAMGRKFVRVALGGIRDEAEIRGHRRTYVGSQPGRIARAMTEAGTMNPVDPARRGRQAVAGRLVGRSHGGAARGARPGAEPHVPRPLPRGRPRPVATSCSSPPPTSLDTIPGAAARPHGRRAPRRLHRRREGVHRPPLPAAPPAGAGRAASRRARRRRRHRSSPSSASYTREAGVRSLERELGTPRPQGGRQDRLRRRGAGARRRTRCSEWIGRPKIVDDVPERTELPGVATGLAVTGAGGDVLFIETTAFPTGRRRRARADADRSAR